MKFIDPCKWLSHFVFVYSINTKGCLYKLSNRLCNNGSFLKHMQNRTHAESSLSLPSQYVPLPVKPSLQVQVKEPIVLVQVA